jgi:hypothetical protein
VLGNLFHIIFVEQRLRILGNGACSQRENSRGDERKHGRLPEKYFIQAHCSPPLPLVRDWKPKAGLYNGRMIPSRDGFVEADLFRAFWNRSGIFFF